jgi:hypothetical protein
MNGRRKRLSRRFSMMRHKKRPIWPGTLALGIVLTLSTASCRTIPKIEYIHEVPDIIFPVFPPPDSVTLDEETEIVSMPLWYWQEIAEYKIDVDAVETYIKLLRAEQDVQKMRELKEGGSKK